jgi:hypothetical protein
MRGQWQLCNGFAIDWPKLTAVIIAFVTEAAMNRHYYWLKGGLIAIAFCVAIAGSSIGTAGLHPRSSHSPFTAADTMQAGIYHAGPWLGHFALKLFYFAR